MKKSLFLIAIVLVVLLNSLLALETPLAVLLNNPDYGEKLSPLEKFLQDNEIPYTLYKTFKNKFPEKENYSALIIGGGSSFLNYFASTGDELRGIELIKNTGKPILGICLGSQILGKAYGVNLKYDEERKWNTLNVVKEDIIFTGIPEKCNVWENHAYALDNVPDDFELLATDSDGTIQVIKHKDKYVYGFQFHPEKDDGKKINHGKMLFFNFIALVEYLEKANSGR
ncbi:MAG: gamma-glutamyl-gamma-aminobutyrate hydrolase family protein [Kosmotogaceae bacterium]